MSETRKSSYLRGAAILATVAIITKVITALFKIPLYNLLGDNGSGHFQVTLNLYTLLLTISTAGIPVALSRVVSAASSTGKTKLVKRYFSVALPAFLVIGLLVMLVMMVFPEQLAKLMGNEEGVAGIRILAPAVLFSCIIAVYRGYFQGHNEMMPTAISQLMEASCKLVFGLLIAWILIQRGFDSSIATAGAYSGSTIGLGLAIPVLIIYKIRYDRAHSAGLASASRQDLPSRKAALSMIFKVSVPIMLGSSILSVMTFIDTRVVLTQLKTYLTPDSAIALYGVYGKGLSLFNLPASLIGTVAVSIVPAIAAAVANNRRRESKEIMESSMKLTNLLAMPAGIGLCVLAYPIFNVVYWGSNDVGPTLLATLAIASYFVCMQLITTGILQANGYEKIPLLTCTIGGILQILLDWYLTGIPEINIVGSPFGTLTCYGSITLLNLIFILVKVKNKPDFGKAFIKPGLCTAVMGVAAWAIYELLYKLGSSSLGSGRLALGIYLLGAIVLAIAVYGILIVATKTITRDDMRLIPRGEKISNFLKIK